MPYDISKECSDFLRSHVAAVISGEKLKASHARELVAAFFGYNTHAALLAEHKHPLHRLGEADILAPDIRLMEQRRSCLEGLPMLPRSIDLARAIADFLILLGHFAGKVWLYESLESYVMDELLREEDSHIMDCLSGVMAETNAYFDEASYESAEVTDLTDGVQLEIFGTYSGSNDEERPFCGDSIDMTVTVNLLRVASKIGFAKPYISASGMVNDDWVDPEVRFPQGSNSVRA